MIRKGRSFSGHERNCAFLNLGAPSESGTPRFATISGLTGLDFDDDGRAVSVVDWDGDGDLDLWIRNRSAPQLRLMRNEAGTDVGHFLALRLAGNGEDVNRAAVGARVEVFLEGGDHPPLVRTVRSGDCFLAQSSRWLHFGLGDREGTQIEKVVVHWPTKENTTEIFEDLKVDTRMVLQQGNPEPEILAMRDPSSLSLSTETLEIPESDGSAKISSVSRFPWPGVSYRTPEGVEKFAPPANGKWQLAMLWGSWCGACAAEMKDLGEHAEDLSESGIEVIALSVDDLENGGTHPEALESVAEAIERTGFPFPYGFIDREQMATLQLLHDFQVRVQPDLPVPTSFLVGPDGRIVSIYKGTVSSDQIVADVSNPALDLAERDRRARELGGTRVPSEAMWQARISREAAFHRNAGRVLMTKSARTALAFLKESLVHEPDSEETGELIVDAHVRLRNTPAAISELLRLEQLPALSEERKAAHAYHRGVLLLQDEQRSAALAAFRDSIRHVPASIPALNNAAYLLATAADPTENELSEAIRNSERAVALTNRRSPRILETLATVNEKAGRKRQAREILEEAKILAEESGDLDLASKLRSRLEKGR